MRNQEILHQYTCMYIYYCSLYAYLYTCIHATDIIRHIGNMVGANETFALLSRKLFIKIYDRHLKLVLSYCLCEKNKKPTYLFKLFLLFCFTNVCVFNTPCQIRRSQQYMSMAKNPISKKKQTNFMAF